ncbi:MAG TPA: arabinosyltransferase domain-containing protein [Pseudonocardiaceae bacterium]|nr:arabinosyltransferase domain-containing protein [Pseudonocardiaceae bacterium]
MLTSGHIEITRRGSSPENDDGDAEDRPDAVDRGRAPRLLRLAAAVLGLLGALLAIAVPLLPVIQDTTVITWPNGKHLAPVNAPLVTFQPQNLTATIPCAAAFSVDARSTQPASLLSTTPPGSTDGAAVGMVLQVVDGKLTLVSRGQALGNILLNTIPPANDQCLIKITSNAKGTTASAGATRFVKVTQDVRPQVTGIYSALDERLDPVTGLSVQITPDTRFQSVPHPIKLLAIELAVLTVLISLILVHRLDGRVGRRAPRLLPSGWWRPTGRDATVLAVLAVWVVIGGITSDDGYILTMIRTRAEMGYIGNYYRWFNVPEAPFGWPYELYAYWSQISTVPPWLRLPAFAMGGVSWMLISREVMPRLGREVRRSAAAGWAAAGVFLAFWLPYNNGLRLEPVVAIGSLLVLCAVERAVATRRMLPLLLGLIAAAFTVAATPTGFIAVAPFLVSLRPLLRLLHQHIAAFGRTAVLGPALGAGLLVLVVIFADQTLAGVLEATKIRTEIGPNLSWFQEPLRYQWLFSDMPDGALARRFPVLMLLLCLGTSLVVLLRRGGIPGAGLGPSRRLIGTAGTALALLALTPTKWTHHFGAFASIGAALAALTALATSSNVLRSARNRWWFLSGMLLILAMSATGPNAPWYVSQYGVPWFDKPPSIHGFQASTLLIVGAVLAALIAVIEGLRHEPGGPPPPVPDRRSGRRALRIASAPIAVFCGLLVVAEVAVMVKAMHKQRDGYSMAAANIAHITGHSCNLTDAVAVEPDRRAGALRPLHGTLLADIPLQRGFELNRFPVQASPTTSPASNPGDRADGQSARGDRLPKPGNDSDTPDNPVQAPPSGLGGAEIPIWSSFNPDSAGTGNVRTTWYALPVAARQGRAPVVVSVAGKLSATTPLFAEFARRTERGFQIIDQTAIGGRATANAPGWRDYRLGVGGRAAGADAVRLIAIDADVTDEGWLAFSAPRVPVLSSLTDLVAPTPPVFLDWPVGFVHPCVRPFGIRNGIAELPQYRLLPDEVLTDYSKTWSSRDAGGPIGWLQILATQHEVPTYLKENWDTDWGKLMVIQPRVPDAAGPTLKTGTAVRTGWWSPGPLRSGGQTAAISQLGR